MGMVFKAQQVTLNRIVAVKLLSVQMGQGGLDFAARFKVEAQAMARISHPGIVPVHDFGTASDGQLFYVMEFVEGTDLAKRIESEGKLSAEEALRIMLAVCDALACAHAEGVVHRDIKPSNILISRDGKVKVADFGLAKIDAPETASLTLSGTTMGSQGYAAPEVFSKASSADHRADIYSLGVMFYQMLTGTMPRGMFKLPSEKVPGLDTRFDAIICQAMEEDREDRQQSVAELRGELEAILSPASLSLMPRESHDIHVSSRELIQPAPTARHRIAWSRVAMFTLVIGLMAWLALSRVPPDEAAPDSSPWKNLLKNDGGHLRRSLQGNWVSVDGSLQGPPESAAQPALCGLSWDKPDSCDLRFRITKLAGADGVVYFGFRHGDSSGGIIFSDRRTDSGVPFVGMTTLEGGNADKDSSWVRRQTASFLPVGQEREVRLLLRDDGVAVWLDGIEVYRWKGDWNKLSQSPPLFLASHARGPVFAIGSHRAKIAIRSAEAMLVTGEEAQKLPDVPPVEFHGHRYQYIPGSFTWMEAEANAASLGGHLATLTSAEENHWGWTHFSPYLPTLDKRALPERGWWIGGRPLEMGKGWEWVTGEPFEYTCWSLAKPPPARTPRLRQHNNGGGGSLSAWSPVHYSNRCGYLVEWDESTSTSSSDTETRQLAAWLFSLPLSNEPSHQDHKVPDVMIEGSVRNFRKLSEMPATPFTFSRIRIGPLPMGDQARRHLDILAQQKRLYDLRIYAAEDAGALNCVNALTRLGTLVFKSMPGKPRKLTDEQLAPLGRV